MGDAAEAGGRAEVSAALEQAVGGVFGCWTRHGEVVVGGGVRGVDKGGEERVDATLVGRPGGVLELGAATVHERICSGHCRRSKSTEQGDQREEEREREKRQGHLIRLF